MASRPVFSVKNSPPFYQEELISFQFNAGFSISQKRKNIHAIHEAFCMKHRNARTLEISSKSDVVIGTKLSAFNLIITIGNVKTTVESAFQGGKVFQYGGPYSELLLAPSYTAKKDPRLLTSGDLQAFIVNGVVFPLEPKTFFYDWLYINALSQDDKLAEQVCEYNAFTDIEFNPNKSINCQARSAAIFVSLSKTNWLKEALFSPKQFKQIVYGEESIMVNEQISLF